MQLSIYNRNGGHDGEWSELLNKANTDYGSLAEAFPSFFTGAVKSSRQLVERAEAEIRLLHEVIANARREEELIERLLALRGHVSRAVPAEQASSLRHKTPPTASNPMIQAVVEAIGAAGLPVHISELMRMLMEREVPIPGSGTQANVISHLRRSPEIVRTSRGMYALAEWGISEAPTKKPRAKPKTRRRRSRVKVTK
jgi:hypothetical protein